MNKEKSTHYYSIRNLIKNLIKDSTAPFRNFFFFFFNFSQVRPLEITVVIQLDISINSVHFVDFCTHVNNKCLASLIVNNYTKIADYFFHFTKINCLSITLIGGLRCIAYSISIHIIFRKNLFV